MLTFRVLRNTLKPIQKTYKQIELCLENLSALWNYVSFPQYNKPVAWKVMINYIYKYPVMDQS